MEEDLLQARIDNIELEVWGHSKQQESMHNIEHRISSLESTIRDMENKVPSVLSLVKLFNGTIELNNKKKNLSALLDAVNVLILKRGELTVSLQHLHTVEQSQGVLDRSQSLDVSALHGRMTSVTDKIGRLVECHDRHTGYLNTLIDQYEALINQLSMKMVVWEEKAAVIPDLQ